MKLKENVVYNSVLIIIILITLFLVLFVHTNNTKKDDGKVDLYMTCPYEE